MDRQDADALSKALADACNKAGLQAEVLRATAVRVSAGVARLMETVVLAPAEDERLHWFWSWAEPICIADDITNAVQKIGNVVTPPTLCTTAKGE